MLKSAALAGAALAAGTQSVTFAEDIPAEPIYSGGTPWADLLGWKVGCQAYSFNRYTFEEALQKNASIGLRYIQMFPGQKLSKEHADVAIGPGMTKEQRYWLKSLLAEYHTVPLSIGVIGADRGTFEFAADLGLPNIASEPAFDRLKDVDKLAQEYGVNVALHNHPKPSIYWDYHIVLEHIKDLSDRVGACADTGHYIRSGINPLEAVKALKGKIKEFHFKDLHENSRGGHDVIWGTGVCDVPAILAELKEQNFKGPFFAEYEYNWESSVPEIAAGMKFFNETAKELAK
jgi:sugar phosphate isomerase/epimerase